MSEDKIELTEEMVNTLDNPPKANDAFKAAAKKYKGEDIKMADVFDLPFSVEPSGVISDDHCIASGEFCGTMEQSKAAVHAINSHDILTQQVAELRAALSEVFTISERSNEQNPSNFDQDLAMKHNEDICEIYHLVKALKEGE